MLTNADITIFNKIPNQSKKCFEYVGHYISDVSFYTDQKVSVGDGGLKSANVYKIRIQEESLEGYVLPDEFMKTYSGWTVNTGDLFVLGHYAGNITGVADLADCNRPYGIVNSWSDNRNGGLPHIRIGGST